MMRHPPSVGWISKLANVRILGELGEEEEEEEEEEKAAVRD